MEEILQSGEDADTILLHGHPEHGKCVAKRFRNAKTCAEECALCAAVADLPHVAKLLGHDEMTLYFPFYGGGSLEKRLAETEVDPKQTEEWRRQVGTMIKNLHAKGIAHGDFKAKNIMINDTSLILIDFGHAGVQASYEKRFKDLQKQVYLDYQLEHCCSYAFATFSMYLQDRLRDKHPCIRTLCHLWKKNDYDYEELRYRLQEGLLQQQSARGADCAKGDFGNLVVFLMNRYEHDVDKMHGWIAEWNRADTTEHVGDAGNADDAQLLASTTRENVDEFLSSNEVPVVKKRGKPPAPLGSIYAVDGSIHGPYDDLEPKTKVKMRQEYHWVYVEKMDGWIAERNQQEPASSGWLLI